VIFPGASSTALVESQLDTPLSFEAMAAIGSGLGAGGFAVYDETTCVVAGAAVLPVPPRRSVRPVPPCKLNSGDVVEFLEALQRGIRRPTSMRPWPGPGGPRTGRSARCRPGRAC
jgi:NADH-quinone oxidoreductase subunit F